MRVLESFWRGTDAPCAKAFYDREDYRAASHRYMEADRRLRAVLNGDQGILLDELEDAEAELNGIDRREMFYYAFTLGARLMLDVLA